MKRLIVLLLGLLLLTGCTTAPPDATPETVRPTQETGFHVQTDYSAYKPHQPQPEVYTRLSEEFMDGLTPSEDYGAIYPFCGNLLYANWTDQALGEEYGIVTENGMIISDPVYESVEPLRDYDALDNVTYYPIWLLRRAYSAELEMTYETTLSTWDGSKISEHTYRFVRACGDVILGIRYHEAVADVLDPNCNILFSTENMELPVSLAENYRGSDYTDGLLLLCAQAGQVENVQYYFVTPEGEVALGPFAGASSFAEGYAVVTEDGNNFYYIDREGNRLNDRTYIDCQVFRAGYALAIPSDGGAEVLDQSGACVFSFPNHATVLREADGFEVYLNGKVTYYDKNFQPTVKIDYAGDGLNSFGGNDLYYRYLAGEKGFEVIDAQSGEVVYSFQSDTFVNFNYEGTADNYFMVYEYVEETDVTTTHIVDMNFEERYVTTGAILSPEDDMNGEKYFCIAEQGKLSLYGDDLQLKFQIPWNGNVYEYGAVTVKDGKLFLYNQSESLIYDADGTLLFRYRLPSWNGD